MEDSGGRGGGLDTGFGTRLAIVVMADELPIPQITSGGTRVTTL